ncbi:hypothetical protein CMUS01_09545 [Colletotrichum musicola]|uniref:Uncharacterized protein n=1 Tax=Colletotrichum musicola TaxID=2175873 RepID=A0A8H6K873_9PEZI|nr:hypothetical protein CMUS01_09545 [Colletotrichum musicola]
MPLRHYLKYQAESHSLIVPIPPPWNSTSRDLALRDPQAEANSSLSGYATLSDPARRPLASGASTRSAPTSNSSHHRLARPAIALLRRDAVSYSADLQGEPR